METSQTVSVSSTQKPTVDLTRFKFEPFDVPRESRNLNNWEVSQVRSTRIEDLPMINK